MKPASRRRLRRSVERDLHHFAIRSLERVSNAAKPGREVLLQATLEGALGEGCPEGGERYRIALGMDAPNVGYVVRHTRPRLPHPSS